MNNSYKKLQFQGAINSREQNVVIHNELKENPNVLLFEIVNKTSICSGVSEASIV